jgi:hypothetical protein
MPEERRRLGRRRQFEGLTQLSTYVEQSDMEALREMASEQGGTIASHVRKAIRDYLAKHGRDEPEKS